ncbi:MAG: arginase family protein, partial [Melioribacteraceae bacterium]|nr:arginase family protein [Melioribacteraceae bacterium]
MKLKNYSVTDDKIWTGRVDDPNDIDSYRMHQVIQVLDLREIDQKEFDLSNLNICFIGFRCDEGVKRNLGRQGAKNGPEIIRKEFANLPVTFGESAVIYDAGNITCVGNNMEEAQGQLEIAVKIILENGLFPLVLGGGHELALAHYNGIVSHLNNKEKDDPSIAIINFDAHLDLRPYNKGGSSGTMFYQIADDCLREKRQFAYMCLGVQTYSNTLSLFKRADSLGVKYILAKDFVEPNYESISAEINNFIDNQKYLYVTLDCDVFNSASAPGVSAVQPFGMDPEV